MPTCAESTWEAERAYIDQTIRYWAHVRSRSFCRTTEDCEDLSQDLHHHLWKQLDHYDPNRAGRRTFIAMVVESRFLTLRRSARLKSRGYGVEHSTWNNPPSGPEGQSQDLQELVSEEDALRMTKRYRSTNEERRDLALDCKWAIEQLAPFEAEACRLLPEMSKSEAARRLGVPRTTLHDITRRIARKLEAAGMRDYCRPARQSGKRRSK